MTVTITNTDNAASQGITALIYGQPGIGKTSLLGNLPGRTLVIDIEGGTSVLRGKGVDTISVPESLANLKEIFEYLEHPNLPYANVCLDSVTELQLYMLITLGKLGKNDGVPEMAHYQRMQFKLREYLRTLRDLRAVGINVVVTALEQSVMLEQSEGFAKSFLQPALSAKIVSEVCGLFDIVGHMFVSAKPEHEGQRFIRLATDGTLEAKDRVFGRKYCKATGSDLFNITTKAPEPGPVSKTTEQGE